MKRPLGVIGLAYLSALAVFFHYGAGVVTPLLCIAAAACVVGAVVWKLLQRDSRVPVKMMAVGLSVLAAAVSLTLFRVWKVQPAVNYYSEKEILTIGGKPAAVPCCPSTNGYTEATQTYPYLRAVASPWDAFCAYRDSGQACVGVSLNGLDWLCRHGLSAEEALLWYLPGMEISS